MTGKDWIMGVTDTLHDMEDSISRDSERIDTLKMNLISTTAIQYDSDKVQSSCEGDKIAQQYALYFELDKRIGQEYEKMMKFRSQSIERLNNYVKNPTLAFCLERRHIQFKSVAVIAQEDNVTEICIKKRFNKAYNLLNSIYILEKYRKSC